MKKLISLIAALAMVSSLFVTTSFAAVPASATLNVIATEADEDQIQEYEGNVDAVPAGYTLYAVTFSQTGLGDWENTNTKTIAAQLKKPTGWLANYIGIQMDFGSDIANLYGDTDYYFIVSDFDFGITIADDTKLTLQFGSWTNAVNYPLNAKGTSALEEGDAIAVLYVPVSNAATCTFTEMTVIAMQEYADGVAQAIDGGSDTAEYSLANSNFTLPASVTLGAPATVDVTSVTISGDTAATVGDNVQLSATVLPANATDPTVTWTKVSGDGAVSASGVVTANSAGAIVVKATAGGVDSTNYTVTFAAPGPAPVYTDSEINVKKPVSGTTGLTDLQDQAVTLTANYGIAKFSTEIDTAAKNYFVVATDSNDVEQEFSVDFAAKGVEISNASTTFFAIVKSADHIIKSIRLKEVAKEAD